MKILFDDKIVYSIRDIKVIKSYDVSYWEAFVRIQKEHPEIGFQFYFGQDGKLDWKIYYISVAKRNGKKIVTLDRQRSE